MKITTLLISILSSVFAQTQTLSFDLQDGMKRLEPGSNVIRGVALAKEIDTRKIQIANLSKSHRARPGTQVVLYPLTPYLEEILKLRKNPRSQASLSPEAFSCRILTWTNEEGEFEFRDLQPGSYYIEARVSFVQRTVSKTQTGTEATVFGNVPTYSYESGSRGASRLVSAIAEVKADTSVTTIVLKN